jgi:hypothetical protein
MKTYGTACVFFMRYRYYAATKGAEDEAANRYDFRVSLISHTVCLSIGEV